MFFFRKTINQYTGITVRDTWYGRDTWYREKMFYQNKLIIIGEISIILITLALA